MMKKLILCQPFDIISPLTQLTETKVMLKYSTRKTEKCTRELGYLNVISSEKIFSKLEVNN